MLKSFAGTLPIAGTEVAAQWDQLYQFLFWLSVFFVIVVVGGMIYFAIRYRSSAHPQPKYITSNHTLELIWTIIPTLLLLVIFGWGYHVYHAMTNAPSDAYEVRVIAKQWLWQFQYEDGRTTVGEAYVPVNQPVKFIMTSEDVLHSMFIPNFRVKQDVVPGMYTSVWFETTVPGKHQIFCAEYCGTSHSEMLGQVIALEPAQWERWKAGKKVIIAGESTESKLTPTSLPARGKEIATAKGCMTCHSEDGTRKVGPSFKGIYGRKEEMVDGTLVLVDDNYLRESMDNPQAQVVKGYPPAMPSFKGLVREDEMNALIAYIKSLKE